MYFFVLCKGNRLYYTSSSESDWGTTIKSNSENQKKYKDFWIMQIHIKTHHRVFFASDMQLTVDLDAAFLVLIKARSRVAGYFRFLNHPSTNRKYNHNIAILIECRAICNVVTSVAETETHGIHHNARIAVPIRHLLFEIGHPQLPVPIKQIIQQQHVLLMETYN